MECSGHERKGHFLLGILRKFIFSWKPLRFGYAMLMKSCLFTCLTGLGDSKSNWDFHLKRCIQDCPCNTGQDGFCTTGSNYRHNLTKIIISSSTGLLVNRDEHGVMDWFRSIGWLELKTRSIVSLGWGLASFLFWTNLKFDYVHFDPMLIICDRD